MENMHYLIGQRSDGSICKQNRGFIHDPETDEFVKLPPKDCTCSPEEEKMVQEIIEKGFMTKKGQNRFNSPIMLSKIFNSNIKGQKPYEKADQRRDRLRESNITYTHYKTFNSLQEYNEWLFLLKV
jgi:hypothetical protein